MTEKLQSRNFRKWACIIIYGMTLFSYGLFGAVIINMVIPWENMFALWMIISAIAGAKLDYQLKGPAYRMEQKYAATIVKETGKEDAH